MSNVKLVLKDINNTSKTIELSELPRYKFSSDKSVGDLIEDLEKYFKLDESKRSIISKSEIFGIWKWSLILLVTSLIVGTFIHL